MNDSISLFIPFLWRSRFMCDAQSLSTWWYLCECKRSR